MTVYLYRAVAVETITEPWLSMEPIRAGAIPDGLGTADLFVTVDHDGRPFARVDYYLTPGCRTFTEAIAWGRFVVVGASGAAHLIDPRSREVRSIPFETYFGNFHPLPDRLLIAGASELVCLDERGEILWKRDDLGIDGVIVDRVEDGIVHGQGEWDPPGGWRPFQLALSSGMSGA